MMNTTIQAIVFAAILLSMACSDLDDCETLPETATVEELGPRDYLYESPDTPWCLSSDQTSFETVIVSYADLKCPSAPLVGAPPEDVGLPIENLDVVTRLGTCSGSVVEYIAVGEAERAKCRVRIDLIDEEPCELGFVGIQAESGPFDICRRYSYRTNESLQYPQCMALVDWGECT